MYNERHIVDRIERLVGAFPVVVISGARQVGKTTLLQHMYPGWDYVVFDAYQDVEGARSDPELFLRNHPAPVIFDEVQYAPELLGAIKRYVDRVSMTGQYILTGSQQWQVMRSVAESLAGRAVFADLSGFNLAEKAGIPSASGSWLPNWISNPDSIMVGQRIDSAKTLYELLWRGSLPRANFLDQDLIPDYWDGYLRTYIERDVRMLLDVTAWQDFGQFVRLTAALSAQEVNYSKFGRDIGVTPQTAKRWLQVLSGTFQWFVLPPFKGNVIKRISGKPKGYFSDSGMICYSLQILSAQAMGSHPAFGALFETAVVNEMRKQLSNNGMKAAIFHWRSNGGAEVDVIIEANGVLYPIEIKSTTNLSGRSASGIKAFKKTYSHLKIANGLVVAPIEKPRWIANDVLGLPWDWLVTAKN